MFIPRAQVRPPTALNHPASTVNVETLLLIPAGRPSREPEAFRAREFSLCRNNEGTESDLSSISVLFDCELRFLKRSTFRFRPAKGIPRTNLISVQFYSEPPPFVLAGEKSVKDHTQVDLDFAARLGQSLP